MKRKLSAAAALVGASLSAHQAKAAVILTTPAPTTAVNTYDSGTINLSAGTLDWVYYLASTTTAPNLTGPAPAQAGSSFSVLSGYNPSTKESYLRHSSTGTGETVAYTVGGSTTSSTGYVFGNGNAVGDGVTMSYTLPALTTETINYYVASYDGLGQYSLSVTGQGTLAQQTTPTALPANSGTNQGDTAGDGTLHASGVYSFTLTNDSASSATVGFTYVDAAAAGGSSSVGIQGVTVTPVPEPVSAGLFILSGLGLLSRRRSR